MEILPLNNNKGSFWWRDITKLVDSYKGMASATVVDGYTSFFWIDVWNGRLLSSQFPELFSFAKDQHISIQSFSSLSVLDATDELFHLPLSSQAYAQFQQLRSILANVTLHAGNDVWSYIWNSSMFASSKAYRNLIGTRQVHAGFKWLWNSSCQPKTKFFFLASSK